MSDLRLVIDKLSTNECDVCGKIIAIGEKYYASKDDRLILCIDCADDSILDDNPWEG